MSGSRRIASAACQWHHWKHTETSVRDVIGIVIRHGTTHRGCDASSAHTVTLTSSPFSTNSRMVVYMAFPGCNRTNEENNNASHRAIDNTGTHTTRRTLSKPAMFWFSAKNSAGDLKRSASPPLAAPFDGAFALDGSPPPDPLLLLAAGALDGVALPMTNSSSDSSSLPSSNPVESDASSSSSSSSDSDAARRLLGAYG